jgi:hypothetical protein
MNCIETEKMIPGFIQDNMNYKDTQEFLKHITTCSTCMEELKIQYLIDVGMKRFEEGSNFNLNKEIEDKIKTAAVKEKRLKVLITFDRLTKAIIMIVILAIALYWLIF